VLWWTAMDCTQCMLRLMWGYNERLTARAAGFQAASSTSLDKHPYFVLLRQYLNYFLKRTPSPGGSMLGGGGGGGGGSAFSAAYSPLSPQQLAAAGTCLSPTLYATAKGEGYLRTCIVCVKHR
jgi:hypothetical protein